VEEGDRGEKASDAKTATLPYLVMEFIDGQSLQQKIDREGALELKEILRIGKQTADGLAAAHAQGLIHRDVKPANILLQNGIERVQITDFGLARAVDDVDITRIGEVAGTPEYMSPEQAQAQPVDVRSDLFSLGSVLYAMCTGRSAFRADTTMGVLRRVCDDTPRPICEIHAEAPDWLVAIVDRLLEKTADDRFQTAAEVADLLGKHLAHVQDPRSTPFPGVVSPVKRRVLRTTNRHPWWVAAGVALVLIAATLGMTEATGVTRLSSTVVRIVTGEGTLVIEIDDPEVQVSLDGEELSITGAGLKEIKLRPGQYQFQATKDGEPLKTELVSITRGDRLIVRVTRESAAPALPIVGEVERGAFVVLNGSGEKVRKFDTLADAVVGSSAGDTIEIRGNGPFLTEPIRIKHPLSIRAGERFFPVIVADSTVSLEWEVPLIDARATLALEGIEIRADSGQHTGKVGILVKAHDAVRMTNCRLEMACSGGCVHASAGLELRNCFLRDTADQGHAILWYTSSDHLHIENCIVVGQLQVDTGKEPRNATLLLNHNTLIDRHFSNNFNLILHESVADERNTKREVLLRVSASQNVVQASGYALACWVASSNTTPITLDAAEELLAQVVDWEEQSNLYRAEDGFLLMYDYALKSFQTSQTTLDGWNRFWGLEDTKSSTDLVRFAGGNLLEKAASSYELRPEDFRLRRDSAGYQAGPDGKDIGANIDFVGPGEAYERWKQTPEYQEWLDQVARLIRGQPANETPADNSAEGG